MKTKKSHEGYMLVDHRFSPGLPEGFFLPGIPDSHITAPPGRMLELGIYTCRHCQKEIIKNPQRTRPRGYCASCDHYICDFCEGLRIHFGCTSIEKKIDQVQEETARNLNIKEF
jgi:hypothetical protein